MAQLHTQMVDFRALTQSQAALVHGVDTRTIRRWTGIGMPRAPGGTYDSAATVVWRVAHTDSNGQVTART